MSTSTSTSTKLELKLKLMLETCQGAFLFLGGKKLEGSKCGNNFTFKVGVEVDVEVDVGKWEDTTETHEKNDRVLFLSSFFSSFRLGVRLVVTTVCYF